LDSNEPFVATPRTSSLTSMAPLRDTSCPVEENTLLPLARTTAAMVELATAPVLVGPLTDDKPPCREKEKRAKAAPASEALAKVTLSIQVAPPWPRVCASAVVAMAEALACSAPNAASP
jgi:hypothetical protein